MKELMTEMYGNLVDHLLNDVYKLVGDPIKASNIMCEFVRKSSVELIKHTETDKGAIARIVKHKSGAIDGGKRENTIGFSGEQPLFSGTVYKHLENANDVSVHGIVRRESSPTEVFRGDKPIFTGVLHVSSDRIDVADGLYKTVIQFKERINGEP